MDATNNKKAENHNIWNNVICKTSMDAIFENIHVQSTINGSTFENHTCPAIWLSGEL